MLKLIEEYPVLTQRKSVVTHSIQRFIKGKFSWTMSAWIPIKHRRKAQCQ